MIKDEIPPNSLVSVCLAVFYLTEILKLDSVLEILYQNKGKAALTLKDIQSKMPFKISDDETAQILDKFRTDNLLIRNERNFARGFVLTYEGVKFYQRGGYLKDTIHHFLKKALKTFIIALGVISTSIGIVLGLRELF